MKLLEIVAHLICESSIGKFQLPIVYIYLLISQAHCFYFVFSKDKNLGVDVLYNNCCHRYFELIFSWRKISVDHYVICPITYKFQMVFGDGTTSVSTNTICSL